MKDAPLPLIAVLAWLSSPSLYLASTVVGNSMGPEDMVRLLPDGRVMAHSAAVSQGTSFAQKSMPARKLH